MRDPSPGPRATRARNAPGAPCYGPAVLLLPWLLFAPLAPAAPADAAAVGQPLPVRPSVPLPPLQLYRTERVGWITLLWSPDFGAEDEELRRRTRAALLYDIQQIEDAVPAAARTALAGSRVAVDPETPWLPWSDGPGRGAVTHISAGWLRSQGVDPGREGVVEIYNTHDYLTWRAEQPLMLLHELTHVLYRVAPREQLAHIEAAYAAAMRAQKYQSLPYILADVTERRPAYARASAVEYAAELAEALFGRNDHFPYVASELAAHDPEGCAAVAALWRAECPR